MAPLTICEDVDAFVVAGAQKARALAAVLNGAVDHQQWPAQLLLTCGDRVEWFVDREAAHLLKE